MTSAAPRGVMPKPKRQTTWKPQKTVASPAMTMHLDYASGVTRARKVTAVVTPAVQTDSASLPPPATLTPEMLLRCYPGNQKLGIARHRDIPRNRKMRIILKHLNRPWILVG